MSERNVRLVAFALQLELVADDGETLAPLDVAPVRYPAAAWPPDLHALIDQVQRQIDGEDQPI